MSALYKPGVTELDQPHLAGAAIIHLQQQSNSLAMFTWMEGFVIVAGRPYCRQNLPDLAIGHITLINRLLVDVCLFLHFFFVLSLHWIIVI